MSAHNIGIYFSQSEARELLNRYSDFVREGKAKKINYEVYRALKDSTYGFYVNENEDVFGDYMLIVGVKNILLKTVEINSLHLLR